MCQADQRAVVRVSGRRYALVWSSTPAVALAPVLLLGLLGFDTLRSNN